MESVDVPIKNTEHDYVLAVKTLNLITVIILNSHASVISTGYSTNISVIMTIYL